MRMSRFARRGSAEEIRAVLRKITCLVLQPPAVIPENTRKIHRASRCGRPAWSLLSTSGMRSRSRARSSVAFLAALVLVGTATMPLMARCVAMDGGRCEPKATATVAAESPHDCHSSPEPASSLSRCCEKDLDAPAMAVTAAAESSFPSADSTAILVVEPDEDVVPPSPDRLVTYRRTLFKRFSAFLI